MIQRCQREPRVISERIPLTLMTAWCIVWYSCFVKWSADFNSRLTSNCSQSPTPFLRTSRMSLLWCSVRLWAFKPCGYDSLVFFSCPQCQRMSISPSTTMFQILTLERVSCTYPVRMVRQQGKHVVGVRLQSMLAWHMMTYGSLISQTLLTEPLCYLLLIGLCNSCAELWREYSDNTYVENSKDEALSTARN